jgi:hypothetical protein
MELFPWTERKYFVCAAPTPVQHVDLSSSINGKI